MEVESVNAKRLDIIYEDDEIIAINKPHGLLVHRSKMARNTDRYAVQELRNQIGQHVYPIHRLDRKTSGILVFAKSKASNQKYQAFFREGKVSKKYLAIVRGFVKEEGIIDYAITYNDKVQGAVTAYTPLKYFEIPFEYKGFSTMRYTLISLQPKTGRFHQLRKHMAHIFHPIIGDRPHGCNKQNRIWKHTFGMETMMLHASELILNPEGEAPVTLVAPMQSEFSDAMEFLKENNLYL